jgi:fimbrial chaperone protein
MSRRLALVLLLLGAAPVARAAGLQLTPIVVELTPGEPRTTISLKNVTEAPVRLELSASAWEQTPDGQTRLAPAPEIVIYPPLLQLAAREERKVRISTTAAFKPVEQAYRLFIQELPPAERPGEARSLRFVTRIGAPIFLLPPRPTVKAEITGTAVHGGKVALTIRNAGNTRLSPGTLRVVGLGADGKPVLAATFDFWYVLAGGERVVEVALPTDGCARVRAVEVEVPLGDSSPVRSRAEAPGGACGP